MLVSWATGEGNGNPVQSSCLENSMDRGACQSTVHAVAESDTTEQLTHIMGCVCVCVCVCARQVCVCVCVCVRAPSRFSRIRLLVTLWPIAHQAPLSMGFSRQEYWSGLPCLPDPGITLEFLMSSALADGFF